MALMALMGLGTNAGRQWYINNNYRPR